MKLSDHLEVTKLFATYDRKNNNKTHADVGISVLRFLCTDGGNATEFYNAEIFEAYKI